MPTIYQNFISNHSLEEEMNEVLTPYKVYVVKKDGPELRAQFYYLEDAREMCQNSFYADKNMQIFDTLEQKYCNITDSRPSFGKGA
jgi:hypothetical protein